MAAPYTKLDVPLNEYSLVCRGCLADSGEMKNIVEWGLYEDFCDITGLQLKHGSGISELLCSTCEDTLMSCKRFRTQCQQSDITLRNIASRTTDDKEENRITFVLDEKSITFNIIAPDTESKIKLICPYDCNTNYIKKKDLLQHLVKTHNASKDFDIITKYYCSYDDCKYNNTKWFTERKTLNQHYNKVHKSKDYNCTNCFNNFSTITDFNRHLKTCNVIYKCDLCKKKYDCNEKLLVHLMRRHPELHKEYKNAKKAEKQKQKFKNIKKNKIDVSEYLIDSPKRSFATQTLSIKDQIKNDVTLPSWQKSDDKTQAFEDVLSMKSQTSEDDMFFSESVSLSDIQTQTFPDFGNRLNKETLTDQQIDYKWTQTCCFCEKNTDYDCPNLMSTETQTQDFKSNVKSDVMLSLNSTQTQTSFDEASKNFL